jgi:integration host factor subunit alpha
VPITPRRVVTFRPSQMLREFVERAGKGGRAKA